MKLQTLFYKSDLIQSVCLFQPKNRYFICVIHTLLLNFFPSLIWKTQHFPLFVYRRCVNKNQNHVKTNVIYLLRFHIYYLGKFNSIYARLYFFEIYRYTYLYFKIVHKLQLSTVSSDLYFSIFRSGYFSSNFSIMIFSL